MRLNQHKFQAWLKSKKPDTIVGEHRDCHSCPIANFYLETSGGCEIVIFDRGNDYRIDRGNDARLPPRWVSRFISEVEGQDENEITASRALEILAECAA